VVVAVLVLIHLVVVLVLLLWRFSNAEMQQISQDLVALQEVFNDAAQEVSVQGEQLEVADEAATEAQVNTKVAVKVCACRTRCYVDRESCSARH
jgi:hypothetical protein